MGSGKKNTASNKGGNQGGTSGAKQNTSGGNTTMSPSGDGSNSTPSQNSTSLSPDVAKATEMLLQMKVDLGPLSSVYDTLSQQAAQAAVLSEDSEITQSLNKLRVEMKEQDDTQAKGIEEIKDLINNLIDVQLIDHMQKEVEKGIEAEIDAMVKLQVEQDLKKHIPQELQDELSKSKLELEKVRQALHNSESRLANAELRTEEADGIIHTIYQQNGEISALFPKDLTTLFGLDGEKSKQLLVEYELGEISDSREKNLNRFIQFCSIPYQVPNQPDDDTVAYRSPIAIHYPYMSFPF